MTPKIAVHLQKCAAVFGVFIDIGVLIAAGTHKALGVRWPSEAADTALDLLLNSLPSSALQKAPSSLH